MALLDGVSLAGVPPERRPLHTVFQSCALFPHMTVAGNIAIPLEMAKELAPAIRRRVAETLALVHLEDKAANFPHELSGGQKQRVALAPRPGPASGASPRRRSWPPAASRPTC